MAPSFSAQHGPDQIFRTYRARGFAMLGRFDEARTILDDIRAELAERGGELLLANITGIDSVDVELLAGDPTAAARLGEEGCRQHEQIGPSEMLSVAAGMLAQALYALGQLDEALACATRSAELSITLDSQISWRQVKAKVLARRSEHEEAERLAREAVAIGEQTSMLSAQADAHADLAEVLLLSGKPDEAAEALRQALDRSGRKGNLASAERVRARLEGISDLLPRQT